MTTQPDWPTRLTRDIAAAVRRHRKARGWSAQQLADRCAALGLEIPRPLIADLENGRRAHVSVAELLVLARALGVAPVLLVCPVDDKDETEILPGENRPAFRAAQWVSGEGPYPGPEDADLLTLWTPQTAGSAASLFARRSHDRAAEEELRAAQRAKDHREKAASGTAGERAAYELLAEAETVAAGKAADTEAQIRQYAADRGWPPPQPIMRLVIPRAGESTES